MNYLFIFLAFVGFGLFVASFFVEKIKIFGNKLVPMISLGVLLLGLGSSFFFQAETGIKYHVVSPFGTQTVYDEPGIKFIFPSSIITAWDKNIDIATVPEGASGKDVDGVIRGAIPIRFIDQVTANLEVSTRFELPKDEASFLNIVTKFRTPENLINNTLIPTVREQVFTVAQMYKGEEYVSGASQNFRATLDEALKGGAFVVERKTVRDTIFEDVADVKDLLNKSRKIKEVQSRITVRKKLDSSGKPMRIDHDINSNNILVNQVIVDNVEMEAKFKKKLEEQRDIAAQKSIEIQKIENAKVAQQRIIAEGERDKAEERTQQEKEQVAKLIAIETQVKEEESKRQLAEIALKTSELAAKRRKVEADAKRYEISQADGLSEETRYRIDAQKEIEIQRAKAIGTLKLPNTYVSGGGANGKTNALDLLLLDMLKKKTVTNKN